ncbi:hypothetical protein [Burkholderia territorii]|uniref:hypothetical protein n=1 Tax=Burkholderia territorii TaxID=1503055 RepID=UPI0012DAEABE|nr:hypothetical protein [Burkholderia territorii]
MLLSLRFPVLYLDGLISAFFRPSAAFALKDRLGSARANRFQQLSPDKASHSHASVPYHKYEKCPSHAEQTRKRAMKEASRVYQNPSQLDARGSNPPDTRLPSPQTADPGLSDRRGSAAAPVRSVGLSG